MVIVITFMLAQSDPIKLRALYYLKFSVRQTQRERLSRHVEDNVRSLSNPDPHPPPQHVDRHDGQHLRHRQRKE